MNDAVRAEIARLRGELFDIRTFAEAHHADEDSSMWLHGLTVDIPARIEAALFPVPTSSMTPTSDPQEPVTRPPSAERIAEVRDLHRGPKAAEWHHNFHRDADGSDSCDVCALLDAFDAAEARAAALADARPDAALREALRRCASVADHPWSSDTPAANEALSRITVIANNALAAASPDSAPAGLDRERLASAMDAVVARHNTELTGAWAEEVAAEYDRDPYRASRLAVGYRATPASTTGPGADRG